MCQDTHSVQDTFKGVLIMLKHTRTSFLEVCSDDAMDKSFGCQLAERTSGIPRANFRTPVGTY
jgi:hypothetical protein